MAVFLRDTPIKRKLMLVILLGSGFALFLMGSALITYELITFRRSLAINIGVLAEIIGSNSTAALAFQDAKSAKEILSALSAEHQVTAAAIYDDKGQLFARFPTNIPLENLPANPAKNGHRFVGSHLQLFRPIAQDGSRLGTIYIQADLGEMYSRFGVYGFILLLVSACAAAGTVALTSTLQHRIAQPILELADVANAVSNRQDYSVRAIKRGADEIGQLTDAFNQMLTRIGDSSAALVASEERLRLALEGSETGTWDWNLLTGEVTWDDYMYPLFGRKKAEFDRTINSFMKMVHPDDRQPLQEEIRRTLASKDNMDVDFRIVDENGSVRHMASRGRAFYNDAGKAVRMTGVSLDITASKRNEEDLNRAKESAEAANKAKDNFLAILSHELRTPLTPVLSAVAMLEEDKKVSRHIMPELQMIRRNIEVEARLIDDLLDVTAIIRGKLQLNRQIVDVRSLLEHTMQNYCANDAAKKNLHVSMDVSAPAMHVLADGSRMTQVFWNLLQNACKFTPENGTIEIRAYNHSPGGEVSGGDGAAEKTELIVEIQDTGIGISPENMPRIFKAFEQGERARSRVFGGLGLGLAISRAIIEMHGGRIAAESEGKDKGTKIRISLPTVEAAAMARDNAPRAPSSFEAPGTVRSLRILLVEDHRDTAEQLIRLLKRAGHEVTWVSSIREARKTVAEAQHKQPSSFSILISDLGLPDGSGHDLMRDITGEHPIPGIALSGYGMKDDIEDSLAAGFSRHITKPVDWQELKSAIQKIATREAS